MNRSIYVAGLLGCLLLASMGSSSLHGAPAPAPSPSPSALPSATVNPADEALNKLFHKGKDEFDNQKWEDAIRDLEQVRQKHPAHQPTLLMLGIAYEQTGHLPEAEERFKQALAAGQHFTKGYAQLCDVYLREKKYEEARKQGEAILKYEPKNAQGFYILGVVDYRQGHLAQAADEWERAVKFYEEYPAALYNLGWARYELHEMDQGKRHLLKATLLQTHFSKYEFGLAYVDWASGDKASGSRLLEAARQDARLGPAFGAGAEAFLALQEKQLDKAIARAKAAIELEPEFTKAWVILAQAYQQQGDLVSARLAAEKGYAADINDFEARELMNSLPPAPTPSPSESPASGWSPGVLPTSGWSPGVSPSASVSPSPTPGWNPGVSPTPR